MHHAWGFHQHSSLWPDLVTPRTVRAGGRLRGAKATGKRYHGVPQVELPAPAPLDSRLDEVLARRFSCRHFGGDPVSLATLATWLLHSYGWHGLFTLGELPIPDRPVPSGGGAFPLEVYLFVRRADGLERGLYHVDAEQRVLARLRGPLPWAKVTEMFLGQTSVAECDVVAVITAVVHRTLARYGERGYRFLWMEAGHLAQNLLLTATACDLGGLPIAGFYDQQLAASLDVDPTREVPLYAVALGPIATPDSGSTRALS
ncbi:MAG: SagB/ThcOx family dehydrogenase [Acidobacteriota bacterium]